MNNEHVYRFLKSMQEKYPVNIGSKLVVELQGDELVVYETCKQNYEPDWWEEKERIKITLL